MKTKYASLRFQLAKDSNISYKQNDIAISNIVLDNNNMARLKCGRNESYSHINLNSFCTLTATGILRKTSTNYFKVHNTPKRVQVCNSTQLNTRDNT